MTQNRAPTMEHTVPFTLVLQLIELVKRWHIPADELLAGCGISERPSDPFRRLSLATMTGLLERARVLTGEPGLGYYLALNERASTYGFLGLAASNAATLREAIDLIVRYAPVFSTAISIDLCIDGDFAFLRLHENEDLGRVRDVILIDMMLGLETLALYYVGRQPKGSAEIAIPEPPYQQRFARLVPNWRFGQPGNRLVMETSALDWPIPAADPLSRELMRSLCERALSELGFDHGLVESVRRRIAREDGAFRSLEAVAKEMQLSPRTLTRRLAAQGTTFSALHERERRDRALELLRSSRVPVESVARRLGYAGASTFVRAFRSWTGKTPAAYRREAAVAMRRLPRT